MIFVLAMLFLSGCKFVSDKPLVTEENAIQPFDDNDFIGASNSDGAIIVKTRWFYNLKSQDSKEDEKSTFVSFLPLEQNNLLLMQLWPNDRDVWSYFVMDTQSPTWKILGFEGEKMAQYLRFPVQGCSVKVFYMPVERELCSKEMDIPSTSQRSMLRRPSPV